MNEYAYEWIALAMLIIIEYIYLEYKRLHTNQTKLFSGFIGITITADVINIGYSHITMNYEVIPNVLANIWTMLYLTTSCLIYPTFFLYILEVVQQDEWKRIRLKKILVYMPVVILFVLVLINQFVPFLYSYQNGIMYYTKAFQIIKWIPQGYLTVLLLFCIVHMFGKKHMNRHQIRVVLIYVLSTVTMNILTRLQNTSMLSGISTGFAALAAFIYIENPEFRIDPLTKAWNQSGFQLYCKDRFSHRKQFHAIVIYLSDYNALHLLYSEEKMNGILLSFNEWCSHLHKDVNTFRYSPAVFVLCAQDELVANGCYEKLKQALTYDDDSLAINRFNSNVFLMQNCLQFESTEQFLRRVDLISEFEDIAGKKHYYRNQEINPIITRMMDVEEAVRTAINQKSFEMYFQPVYDVKKKMFTKAEALIRLKDSKLGFIPPDEFITMAEQKGYIRKITRQVIDQTLHLINVYHLQELGVDSININLSTRDLWEGDIKQYLPEVMAKENIPPTMIILEITETATGNKEIAKDFMNNLVSLGYRFAVDDYGTGYSNLERTITLPFDTIKIDKSLFYLSIEEEKVGYLLKHTIDIFHEMNFSVVVEGVETQEHMDILDHLNVDYIQGYFYSKPLPVEQYVAFLKEHNQIGGSATVISE